MALNDMGFEARGAFEPIKEGTYDAVVHAVVGLGLNRSFYKDQEKAPAVNVKIIYELPDVERDDGTTATIAQRLKLSTHEKSRCYQMLSTLLGKKLTGSEALNAVSSEGLKNLLGKQATVTISHWIKDDKAIPVVSEVNKLDPRLAAAATKGKRETFFFNPLSPDLNVFKSFLTFGTQEQVMKAENASNFPKDLHEAWVKIQEDKANKADAQDRNSYNTGSIE